MPSTLGYWDVRGMAQPIRFLLAYAGEDVEEVRYSMLPDKDAPLGFTKGEWPEAKEKLLATAGQFANLPFYKDDSLEHPLFQTHAILRYLARKYKLGGSSEAEYQKIDLIFEQMVDSKTSWIRVIYVPIKPGDVDAYMAAMPERLKGFSQILADNDWFAGKQLTVADFLMYEWLDWHRVIPEIRPSASVWSQYPNLANFINRFEALPAVKKYMGTDQFIAWPVTNKFANFGSIYSKKD